MSKPDCYKCAHRRKAQWSAHSRCVHPSIKDDGLFEAVVAIMAAAGRAGNLPNPMAELGVTGDPHGIRNGWFFWPVDFDPVWLRSCDKGFTKATDGEGERC